MTLTETFLMPPDAVLAAVNSYNEEIRCKIGVLDDTNLADGYVLSRTNSRSHSKLLDADSAELLRQFEAPTTIPFAIARYSRAQARDAEEVLEASLPMFVSLIEAELLVPAGSAAASVRQPSLNGVARIGEWEIVGCVQSLEDSEVYRVRGALGQFAALKIDSSLSQRNLAVIVREAATLARLHGQFTPRLFATGRHQGRDYLVIEWFPGVDVETAAAELRREQTPESKDRLLALCRNIIAAYTYLHNQGVTHGDIHPRNILANRHAEICLIDFGLACFPDHYIDNSIVNDAESAELLKGIDHIEKSKIEKKLGSWGRGGVSFFYEPEFAGALNAGQAVPHSTPLGEQYSLAALLYLLLTGSHYLDFSLEKSRLFRQIEREPMRPFASLGLAAWREVETVLTRALSKDPAARYCSTESLLEAWPQSAPIGLPQAAQKLSDIREDMLVRCGLGSSLMESGSIAAPSTSVNYGSAGIAHALHRLAEAANDGELLALSDLWSIRSLNELGASGAFYDGNEITPEKVGRTSLYHGQAGVLVVHALVAQSRGNLVSARKAATAFLNFVKEPDERLDLTLGKAGLLLGCSLLRDALDVEPEDLISRGHQLCESIWAELNTYAPVSAQSGLTNIGIAHGWAGMIYATLCWSAASGQGIPATLPDRLRQLASLATPHGRGVAWPWDLARQPNVMPGWCNGSAGHVFLWTEAYQSLREASYLDLAEGAAWHAWETRSGSPSLCCGLGGQAYALLRMYRHSGESTWLTRARELFAQAAEASTHWRGREPLSLDTRSESLYKGEMGLAVLEADLKQPEFARMPLFEPMIGNY